MDTTTTTVAAEQDVSAGPRPAAGLPAPAWPPAGVVNPLPLHWFQKDAVAAAVKDGGRATVVAATGSGKTLIAAGCARRLAAKGSVRVLVPTIELLEQSAESWSLKGGRRGMAVAACSRQEALESAGASGGSTPLTWFGSRGLSSASSGCGQPTVRHIACAQRSSGVPGRSTY